MATCSLHGEDSPYFAGWEEYRNNPYDVKLNPSGVIQMGLAENTLSFGVMEDWLIKHPEATITSEQSLGLFKDLALYQDYHGLSDYRKAMASFMEAMRGNRVKFDPDRIVNAAGSTAANEVLMFCLADPGDVFLVPSPYYPGFDRDLRWRTGVEIEPIHCYSSNNFQITKSAVESAFKRAKDQKKQVKGILITNPCNPLGTISSADTLKMLLAFANKKKIHLVCDEIYSGSVFSSPEFHSIAEIVAQENYSPDNVHIVYSLSKDMGLPGFRVGTIYSYNDTVVMAARRMSSFTMISTKTQHLLSTMLSDPEFVNYYIAENKKRLEERHRLIVSGFEQAGIKQLEGNAGLFCWVNMSHLLPSNDIEGELKLWKGILYKAKLNISPGSSFKCMEPGWFRVCFSEMTISTMKVALERLQRFVKQNKVMTH
ncbi:1-aminocyclopropane-1-carboxylate synthase 8-like [Cryptomeria japonica]|uniref:1-aminocyclopropane-1-carboxylate synthase 8-like n=1 Tax=Cryptomeria japonica TaxID=3369 RepID=UPI0025AD3D00|nr:1-aminocyclopropane-1-carboxylate synthase 8-like [Cryptomeria japonica]